ncbi:hypothetical protein Cni_G05930 [Canna indica]|uniref:Uncharacterized protein n=1 Tax=Canna indica TaxID=4628 RepID=A0AAQ3Q5V6_9LILI|nr:hypothetical protein Cni_G05930 [Canna indica]
MYFLPSFSSISLLMMVVNTRRDPRVGILFAGILVAMNGCEMSGHYQIHKHFGLNCTSRNYQRGGTLAPFLLPQNHVCMSLMVRSSLETTQLTEAMHGSRMAHSPLTSNKAGEESKRKPTETCWRENSSGPLRVLLAHAPNAPEISCAVRDS